jgi:DNA replication protein DnaC
MLSEVKCTWRESSPSFAQAECNACQGTGWQIVCSSGYSRARRCSCREVTRLMRLKQSMGVPPRYQHCSLDNFQPHNLSQMRALREARRFVERFPGVNRGLMFAGTAGTGKTHLAVAILRDLACRTQEDILFADFASVLQLPGRWSSSVEAGQKLEQRLRQVFVLVLDDFGVCPPSMEHLRFIERLLAERLKRRCLTILTGAEVSCRSLFRDRASSDQSRTQLFLSALQPSFLIQLLSAVRILTMSGEDCRHFHSSLFS